MERERLYKKLSVFPKKLFGEDLYKIVLVNGRLQYIDEIPNGQTYTYTLRIFVDLPQKEVEKYTEEVQAYYKNKTKNTRFKLEAEVISYPRYKLRNRLTATLESDTVYIKEPYCSKICSRLPKSGSSFGISKGYTGVKEG